ncbi:VP1 [Rotavirus J]|uniref:RNA-directed RNA polymerase n=1 Tax=Rotavirus J TaxID=1929964 RepID=A0A1L6BXL2_9REOV|nr:VP1 [Rotavirus J]APQ41753.1 VP1 [Rotavirus J]
MDAADYLEWLSRSTVRNLAYTSLVYSNPKVAIVKINDENENFESVEQRQNSPSQIIEEISQIMKSNKTTDEKLETLLRMRYFSVYVDDKKDKRELVSQMLKKTINEIKTSNECDEMIKDATERIASQARKWKIKNGKSLRPYHHDQPISNFLKTNEFEVLKNEKDEYRWRSDTLEGTIPHYNHRTHTLISSLVFALQSRIHEYSGCKASAIKYLLVKIQERYEEGYLELLPNRKWSLSYSEIFNSKIRLYSAKVIHAASAMITLAHADPIDHVFLCQIISAFEIIPANAAKLLSSPMTLYIGIAQLKSNEVVSTSSAAEVSPTLNPNVQKLSDDQINEWNQEMDEYPLHESIMVKHMKKNIYNVNIESFYLIFNCFSATFHVGHRIDNQQDAIEDQVSVNYTSDVDREMYDQYYHMMKRMFRDEIAFYVDEMAKKFNSDVTAESLSALANSSNGFSKTVTFIDRQIKTTKKLLHLDDDLINNSEGLQNIGAILQNGIPMGTRNVPARQTRGIFILPWQVAAVQHTLAETMYKRAKKGAQNASFAEAYTAKAATLTYGLLAQATSRADQLILYTDVSQWDASQHNTEPYRSAWINAIDEAREIYHVNKSEEPTVLGMNVLDKMKEIQAALLNSKLSIESPGSQRPPKVITYHGVASGEKTTKIGNSYANVALINTILRKVELDLPSIRVTHIRVDGDDNVVTMYVDDNIAKVQSIIKEAYKRMNARVKALASYTGLEMAKRFIISGKIFERGAISIFTAERPYGTDLSAQATTGSLLYSASVNAYRGFGDKYLSFLEDVLVPPSASIRVTGRLRMLLSPVTLFATGPVSFEVTPFGLGGRMRLYSDNEKIMQLFKILTTSLSISVQPDEVKLYSQTKQFDVRVNKIQDSIRRAMNADAKIIIDVARDKEKQKTLGVPNVATTKNRSQIEKARKTLSFKEEKLSKVKDFYPEELFIEFIKNSKVEEFKSVEFTPIYMHNSERIRLLQQQLGVRISDRHLFSKPKNTLLDLVSKHSPIKISPDDLVKYSRKYNLTTLEGKKKFLIDLGLTGSELRYYLSSKLLMHDLLISKYDKLYETPGFGATQLTSIPLDLSAAETIFKCNVPMPHNYYEILMLILLYEYVHYVLFTGKRFTAVITVNSPKNAAKLTSRLMKMIDNLQLDVVSFSDVVY